MTRIILSLTMVFLVLGGVGCLETALKYPKDYSEFSEEKFLNSQNSNRETVKLTGVISTLNFENKTFQLILTDGSSENIQLAPDVVLSLNNEKQTDLNFLTNGSLAEIFGTRDLASLITTARTVRVFNNQPIFIISPEAGSTITSPIIIDGFVNLATDKIYWQIKNPQDEIKSSGVRKIITETKKFFPLRLEIFLPALKTNDFSLKIFSKNPFTEIEENLVILPLNLLSINSSQFKVFFANDRLDNPASCQSVFPVDRTVAETSATGRAALLEILNGPTEIERYEGYRSGLPYGTTINSFVVSGGVATVTVSSELKKLSSCEEKRAEEQIRQTLLQIGAVKEVVIRNE